MCLAIAPVNRERPGRVQRWWRPLASSPLRLLAFGAVLHILVIAGLGAGGRLPGGSGAPGLSFILSYGIAGPVLLGFLLTWLPARFRREPVHYATYTTIWFLLLTGLALLEAGWWLGRGWHVAGALLLLLAWVLALRALHWTVLWVWGPPGRALRLLLVSLCAGATGIPVYAGAVLSGSPLLQRYPHGAVWLVIALGIPAVLWYLARHRMAGKPVSRAG